MLYLMGENYSSWLVKVEDGVRIFLFFYLIEMHAVTLVWIFWGGCKQVSNLAFYAQSTSTVISGQKGGWGLQ